MPRTLRELNPEILKERLPDNYREVLDQAERNVNRAVDDLIKGYQEHLDTLAKQLEEGKFSENLQAEIKKLDEQWEANVKAFSDSAKTIQQKSQDVQDALANQDNAALTTAAQELATEAQGLQKRLDEVRAKVKQVGELTGKVAGTALRKFVSGGAL